MKTLYTVFTLTQVRRHTVNNTKLAVNQIRLNEWTEIFKDRSSSGMTIMEYCQAHGLSINAYYYWLRKVRTSVLESQNIEFVEIREPQQAPLVSRKADTDSFHTEAVVSIGSIRIDVNSSTSRQLLLSLMEVAANVK